jgi:hypothetical protein
VTDSGTGPPGADKHHTYFQIGENVMARVIAKTVMIVLASAVPMSGQALAERMIDQEHVPSNGLGGLEITANQAVAQTFTVGLDGILPKSISPKYDTFSVLLPTAIWSSV